MSTRQKPRVGILWLCAPTHVEMADGAGKPLPRKDLAAKTIERWHKEGLPENESYWV